MYFIPEIAKMMEIAGENGWHIFVDWKVFWWKTMDKSDKPLNQCDYQTILDFLNVLDERFSSFLEINLKFERILTNDQDIWHQKCHIIEGRYCTAFGGQQASHQDESADDNFSDKPLRKTKAEKGILIYCCKGSCQKAEVLVLQLLLWTPSNT